jgi:predicted porin
MKKFIAVLAVLALTLVASVAMAEVTVSGSVDIRSRLQNNQDTVSSGTGATKVDGTLNPNADRFRTTEDRFRINIDAKNDNVKGRITFENDWEQWGTQQNSTSGGLLSGIPTGIEARPGQSTASNRFGIREGWIDFTIPGAGPAHVKVGHQFLQLGNGWFFRSMKYGSDAWLVGLPGKNTIAFVDVKAHEGTPGAHDDADAYVLLDNFKIDDTKTVGVYIASIQDTRGLAFTAGFNNAYTAATGTTATLPGAPRPSFQEGAQNTIGLWFNGKLGPMNLAAELDFQLGDLTPSGGGAKSKFKGKQVVLQANMPIDPLSVNATIGYGSGDDPNSSSNDIKSYIPFLDADPHYTFIYEYFAKTACFGLKNTGFCNTTAFNVGAGYAISKNVSVQLDYWMLQATEKVSLNGAALSDKLGSEIDLVLKFKLYDQLTWNWQFGRLMAGDAYKNAQGKVDDVDAIQGILSYKF